MEEPANNNEVITPETAEKVATSSDQTTEEQTTEEQTTEEQTTEEQTPKDQSAENQTAEASQNSQDGSWLQQELSTLKDSVLDGERLPALVLEENKIIEIDVDFSKPFESWTNPEDGTIKKIIPVTQDGEKKIWWLNVRNPVYRHLIERGQKGETHFKILQTGTKKQTRYNIVD